MECLLGYYFAKIKDSDRITVVGGWGERIEKHVKEDVEVLEPVPRKVLEDKYKVLNLRSIQNER